MHRHYDSTTGRLLPISVLLVLGLPVHCFHHAIGRARQVVLPRPPREDLQRHYITLSVLYENYETMSAGMSQDEFSAEIANDDDDEMSMRQEDETSDSATSPLDAETSSGGEDDYDIEVTPGAQQLIARLTENYVFGKAARSTLVDDVLAVVESEFKVRQVPVQIGGAIFDASSTGIALDQTIAEILSFAAYHGLPERLTAELLDDSLGDPFATAKKVFSEQGWQAVSFPQGLGIQPRKQKRRWMWTKRKQERIRDAIRAVRAAAGARNPVRQLSSQKEFLAKLVAEEYSKATKVGLPQKNLPFFPQNMPLPSMSWQRLRRIVQRSSSKIRQKGKAGVLAYAIFNFCVYSAGMLWQWRSIASAEVTSTSNAAALTLRKFGRVFGTVYIVSNLLKVPKLLTVSCLIPLAENILKRVQDRTNMSESWAVIACLAALISVWMALLAVPVLSEFSRIKRLIFLETLLWDQYKVTQPAIALTLA